MSDFKLIQPVEVLRDENGQWFHPDLPAFAGTDEAGPDAPEWKAWLAEQGLRVRTRELEYEDDNHPAYQRYFEAGDPDLSDWHPQPPAGDGWFLLGIGDTDDGPMAFFARREGSQP